MDPTTLFDEESTLKPCTVHIFHNYNQVLVIVDNRVHATIDHTDAIGLARALQTIADEYGGIDHINISA